MRLLTNKIKRFFLDLFFPKNCLGCKQPDTYLCRDCFNKIPLASNNTCFFCEEITGQGRICINCKKEKYLDRIISASEYKNPLIRELIRAFKYHYIQELANPLSQLLIKVLENNFNISSISSTSSILVIPVPLFKHRLHYRGFNQAELIAQEIAKHFKLPIETNAIKRKISRAPQAKISDIEKRKTNIKDVFDIVPSEVEGKIILLVDDVITTGATLSEAAKILKQNNAKEVWGITIAKG
ncbi:MAG: ComF family protein [bacterium]|nr:ComF family protein [bacterium]